MMEMKRRQRWRFRLIIAAGMLPLAAVSALRAESLSPASARTAAPAVAALEFPRYEKLEPAVAFWTDVFATYSENQSVIHSARDPDKVFEVLDFRDQALRLGPGALEKHRASEERAAKARVDALLKQVHALRATPEKMNPAQKRVFDLYSDSQADHRFLAAVGTARAQRGLRERTETALRTSGRYLPAMEATFAGYQLPLRLARLPLVESSFNVEAYSKVGASGLWQFMPSSARIYMRMDELVDDRRDPWASTDGAARHLRDDYASLKSWPLALTAYNHGRSGVARALKSVSGDDLVDLIERHESASWGFASRNFYAEFLAVVDIERDWNAHYAELQRQEPLRFETVETRHYVPYETLRRLCGADDELFRKLNPAYRPEVIEGQLYVPPGHLIRVPAGSASSFHVAYAKLGGSERFDRQKSFYLLHKVGPGDSVGRLAARYGVPQKAIQNANDIRNPALIRVGQVLKIPPKSESRPGPVTAALGESKAGLTRAETAAAGHLPAFKSHKVRSGQTLMAIARLHQVPVAQIQQANGIRDANRIRVGQTLKIPGV